MKMLSTLPDRWKESLGRVRDKIAIFLDRMKTHKEPGQSPEHLTSDIVPAFMETGGPLLDMHESETELQVTVEVPGLRKEELAIELVGKRLIIRGERQIMRERTEKDGGLFSERRYGCFSRSLLLPYEVASSGVQADLKNGILTIKIPRPEKERHRRHRIPVT